MTIAVMKTKAEKTIAEQFEAMAGELPGSGWVGELRRSAIDRFLALGLPHKRIEAWKYTDLRERLKEAPQPAAAGAAARPVTKAAVEAALGPLAALEADRLVLVDGRFRADLSASAAALGPDVELKSMAELLGKAPAWLAEKLDAGRHGAPDAIGALNLAFMTDGILLKVKSGKAPARPLMLVEVRSPAEPRATTTRHVIAVEPGARLTLIEAHVSLAGASAASQGNAICDLTVADGATLEHVKVCVDAREGTHLSSWLVKLGADAAFRGFQMTADTGLARNGIAIAFAGEGARLDLSGAFLTRGSEHVDTTLVVDHAVPRCESRELFKGVLDGRSRAVFQGKIIVRPDAQKTDGKQMSQALMLSPDAEFDSKPELEIYADDVVCGHGATAAELDHDLLFYCRSRGIPLEEARALLIESFIGEALDKVENEPLRAALGSIATQWLGTAGDRG